MVNSGGSSVMKRESMGGGMVEASWLFIDVVWLVRRIRVNRTADVVQQLSNLLTSRVTQLLLLC